MPTAEVNGTEICYQSLGPSDAPACLMVMGLGAQMIIWPDGLVTELLERGFRVVRFDNRDCGLSGATPGRPPDVMALVVAAMAGQPVDAPYTLSDMAADTMGLLDHLGLPAAHVVGASLGGMIAQTIAIEHPHRVRSLTSIMSTTGNVAVGAPEHQALEALLSAPPIERAAAIEHTVTVAKVLAGPHFDEEGARERARESYDRAFRPTGVAFQLAAMAASGDRTEALRQLRCPTAVVHGRLDPLITLSGGEATAEAVPSADLVVLDEMGHDLPEVYWPHIADAVVEVSRRA